jgi:endonuclease/exonuclease/phosphatase family metal-dependent hydrolase
MHLNIWVNGTTVPNGLTKIRDVVAAVKPDIACFVEVDNAAGDFTNKLVNELSSLGQQYYASYVKGSDASIISKYPITSTGPLLRSAVSVFNIDVLGKSVVVAVSHLDYTYYACYLPRGYRCGGSAPYNGWTQIGSPNPQPVTDTTLIAAQNRGSQRDEQMGAFLQYIANETRPVILTGDFNEPSHLDWTARQANLFDHHGVIYEWTTTKALSHNGFTDAYRKIYPDEVLNPGITWPSFANNKGNTSWTPKSDDRDRIDFIFYKGNKVEAVDAAIIGSKASWAKSILTSENIGNDQFLADTLAWPSDHKGVYALISIPNAQDTTTSSRSPGNASSDIKVFPNPGQGMIKILAARNTMAQISLTDAAGNEVFQKKMQLLANSLNTCDMPVVPAGTYLLRIVTDKGVQSLKIIRK